MGWRESVNGIVPVAGCQEVGAIFGNGNFGNDTCDVPDVTTPNNQPATKFVRAFSVFGLCTATMRIHPTTGRLLWVPELTTVTGSGLGLNMHCRRF